MIARVRQKANGSIVLLLTEVPEHSKQTRVIISLLQKNIFTLSKPKNISPQTTTKQQILK